MREAAHFRLASSALNGGHVDAWATWDPFLTVVLQNGSARILSDGAQLGSENAIAYFVSQDFLRAHQAIIAAVFQTLKQENAWARDHKLEAARSG
jgi:sulfonate transport system substrate-binding protein